MARILFLAMLAAFFPQALWAQIVLSEVQGNPGERTGSSL